ncbi:HD domain-containing phosphohydrolase [Roseospira visakhapatnamensis]|uniref:HD-GYP domain-containing protein (C-di-GMP phosphodiesterase class II) n=1 Tax=Roseospira visakhapatnamensis TaxID=390880 RepID=A0A7W6WBZ2_9PROT|nr:HD-GYP domain-containing protein (c-di-GMP phosphodiesterase class II) [Roseospira visakhapatnamensis]
MSLRTKLLWLYVPSLLLVMTVVFGVIEWRAHSAAARDLTQRLDAFVATSADVLAAPLWQFDDALTRQFVAVMAQHPDLRAMSVVTVDGRPVVEVGETEAMQADIDLFRVGRIIYRGRDTEIQMGSLLVAFDEDRLWVALRQRLVSDVVIATIMVLVLMTLVLVTTGRLIFRPLNRLHQAMIADPEPGVVRHVPVSSRDELGEVIDAFNTMEGRRASLEETRSRLIDLGILMGSERNPRRLVETVLRSATELCHTDGGTVYLLDEERDRLEFGIILNTSLGIRLGGDGGDHIPFAPLPLHDSDGAPNHANMATYTALTGRTVHIPDVYDSDEFDFTGPRAFDADNAYRTTSLLAVPLTNRRGEITGVLQLINASDPRAGTTRPFDESEISVAQALAAQAGVALENQLLLEAQRRLMDSFIELIAGAIDAKSPYTGGHCSRVPEVTRLLTEAACEDQGPFRDFDLTEEDWYELHIASWLHDCGKVTIPEYVVDKATKLETIYNRIHEVRTRFEVLWRDAEIEECRALLAGAPPGAAAAAREDRQRQLLDDFAFVAECNIGGEFMGEDRLARLQAIGAQSWTRHFDDRLGLSQAEDLRLQGVPPQPLPVRERLLDDKPEHVIPWPGGVPPLTADNARGFTMLAPDDQFNLGEIYNLSVTRGTLTREERFKINDHMVQTIIMLESLPWPKSLRRVPEIAGGHHETMDGRGYPRGIKAADMSIPARIMAIADIFEALTAADRPYKKPKTLSEALKIMSFMRNDNHIDPELFDLFLRSGVWRRYAETYLLPDQIDAVDISQYQRA